MPQTEEQKARVRERREQERQIEARRSDLYQAHKIANLRRWLAQRDAQDRLRELVPKALDVLTATLDSKEDPKLAATMALAVLRAAGCYDLALVDTGNYRVESYADAELYLETACPRLLTATTEDDGDAENV